MGPFGSETPYLPETLSKLPCGLKLFLFKPSIPLPFPGCQINILI